MPRIYENVKSNFSNFDEFKEVATKTLNEIYGRVKPLDVIDFSYDAEKYKAIGYYDSEKIPAPQETGAPLSAEAAEAERIAREQDDDNKRKAAEQTASEELRIKSLITSKEPLSYEDLVIGHSLGVVIPEEITEQLAAAVKSGRMSFEAAHAAGLVAIDGVPTLEAAANARKAPLVNNAVAEQNKEAAKSELPPEKKLPPGVVNFEGVAISDAALALVKEKGVDIFKIVGTGRDGVIKKSDVADYIANNAPAKENANGNSDEQSNA